MNGEDVFPDVPLTLEGAAVLHQMFRVRWHEWNALDRSLQENILAEATPVLEEMERRQSALFSILGHKADVMVLHYRNKFDELNEAELALVNLRLARFLEPTTSYLSIVELSLYDSTVRLHETMSQKGIRRGSSEWEQEIEATLAQQRKAMAPRLWPEVPPHRYVCFYPMDRRRGEEKNWYTVPIEERRRMMHDHGMIGRRYAGQVKQIISGSIGFDDWEWAVDLFSDDPLVFKKLVYEMRFDEASAVYALFGAFYFGLRFPVPELSTLLSGKVPAYAGELVGSEPRP